MTGSLPLMTEDRDVERLSDMLARSEATAQTFDSPSMLAQVQAARTTLDSLTARLATAERDRDEAREALHRIIVEIDAAKPGSDVGSIVWKIAQAALATPEGKAEDE